MGKGHFSREDTRTADEKVFNVTSHEGNAGHSHSERAAHTPRMATVRKDEHVWVRMGEIRAPAPAGGQVTWAAALGRGWRFLDK